jgi:dihydroorotate dehydrogenase electron transfer subunit
VSATPADPTQHVEPPTRLVEPVTVLANDRIAEGVGLVVLHGPRIAASVRAGQFVHVRVAQGTDFLLRRPFSVHRADPAAGRIEILYQVLGRGTRELADKRPGDAMDAVGPLGTGFSVPEGTAHALVVAGGLGIAPMGMLLEHLASVGVAVTAVVGASTQGRLLAMELLEANARRVLPCTDDGSCGAAGFVTVALPEALADRPDVAYVCGPEPMARAVAAACAKASVPCQVSLERLMACGVGACLSCVVSLRDRQARACVDGPVFDAEEVCWERSEVVPRH